MEAHSDRRSKLVTVAGKEALIGDLDARGNPEQAFHLYRFGNDAAKVPPMGHADSEPFQLAFLREGYPKVFKCNLMALWIEPRGEDPPHRGRPEHRQAERHQSDQCDDGT